MRDTSSCVVAYDKRNIVTSLVSGGSTIVSKYCPGGKQSEGCVK